jgi:DNA-binding transcriptional LysR family regulator
MELRGFAMWHLRDLKYFVAVAEHQNFTRAAQELFVSQPTLSKQIAALERTLNAPLFHREHGGVRLTRAGQALLPYARRILATASDAEAAVGASSAELTIGFWLSPGNGVLPAALARFAALHPGTSVALRRADWSEPWAGVEARRADLGLLWWPEGTRASAKLGQVLLTREQTVVALPATHPLAGKAELSPADLRDEVILDAPPEWRRSLSSARMGKLGRGVHVVRTIDETIEWVTSGLGVILVPSSLVAAHMPATVVARPLRGVPQTELVAVWRPQDESLTHVRSLVRCVMAASQAILPEVRPALPGRDAAQDRVPGVDEGGSLAPVSHDLPRYPGQLQDAPCCELRGRGIHPDLPGTAPLRNQRLQFPQHHRERPPGAGRVGR